MEKSCENFKCTYIFQVYDRLAVYLTELELLRTQTEFEDSLTLKIYLFQFVNYYTSIFYIAFLKGKFVGYPSKYNRSIYHLSYLFYIYIKIVIF